jgi:hypothetical protein
VRVILVEIAAMFSACILVNVSRRFLNFCKHVKPFGGQMNIANFKVFLGFLDVKFWVICFIIANIVCFEFRKFGFTQVFNFFDQ